MATTQVGLISRSWMSIGGHSNCDEPIYRLTMSPWSGTGLASGQIEFIRTLNLPRLA